jgi:hypothetical protein
LEFNRCSTGIQVGLTGCKGLKGFSWVGFTWGSAGVWVRFNWGSAEVHLGFIWGSLGFSWGLAEVHSWGATGAISILKN